LALPSKPRLVSAKYADGAQYLRSKIHACHHRPATWQAQCGRIGTNIFCETSASLPKLTPSRLGLFPANGTIAEP
jgi:hypothetical protein